MNTTLTRALTCSLYAAFSLSVAAESSGSHPGDLDPDFGTGGIMVTDFVGRDEQVSALAPLPNGSFLAAGYVTHANVTAGTSENLAVARFLPNGQLDPDFASAGLFHMDIASGVDGARAMKVLPDGRILVAGSLSPGAYANFGIVKLLPNGSLDPDFGAVFNGLYRYGSNMLDIGGVSVHDNAKAMAVQPDGRIIVAGVTPVMHASGFKYNHIAVARFLASGPIDTSFGDNGTGYVILPGSYADSAEDITSIATDQAGDMPSDGRIILTGIASGQSSGFIYQLTANGALDTDFGDSNGSGLRTGRVVLTTSTTAGAFKGLSEVNAARIASGGKIVVVGTGADRGFTFMRFNADGTLDSGFGNDGRSTIKYSGSTQYDEPSALAMQENGKLVAVGYATSNATGAPHQDFFVARVLADGSPDDGFGDGQGRSITQVSNSTDEALAVAVEPSGNLLVGGYQQRPGAPNQQYDFAVLRTFGDSERIFKHGFETGAN